MSFRDEEYARPRIGQSGDLFRHDADVRISDQLAVERLDERCVLRSGGSNDAGNCVQTARFVDNGGHEGGI